MGLATVAVYSDADRSSAHAAAADEARLIGPAEAAKSYLNVEAIIEAARAAGATAIHPGYGFLSERPEFARAVEAAGIIFVGPPPEVMAAMGDKVAARRLASKAGVPVVPGVETAEMGEAQAFAAKAGFPLLVKAAAGGGGRGMRVVADAAAMPAAIETASSEARAAFGDGRVFIEKYLARPRHVEVQVMGDGKGAVVAYGERDCSVQRRHQKIIEESPAPGLSDATRARMISAALELARSVRYRSAGTMEFLLDGDDFYFLEMNTRLQVEHPVTEMRFGCDLVAEQLRLAMGEPLTEPDAPRGAAIECRIYAEDAARDFRPATGTVLGLNLPAGPGVRVDTHLTPGLEVTTFYDGMLAKLICWGADREQARMRLAAALDEFMLLGVINTAAFLRDVIACEPFRKAHLSTHLLEESMSRWSPPPEAADAILIAAALASAGMLGTKSIGGSGASGGSLRRNGRSPWDDLAGFEPVARR